MDPELKNLLERLSRNLDANTQILTALKSSGEIDQALAKAMRLSLAHDYDVKSYSLTLAQTDKKESIDGTFLHAWTDGDPTTTGLRINSKAHDIIYLDKRDVFDGRFVEYYITNIAQPSKTLNILIGRGGSFRGLPPSLSVVGPLLLTATNGESLASTSVVTATLDPGIIQGYNEKTIFIKATASGSPGILTCRVGLSPSVAQSAYWYLEPIVFSDQMSGAQFQMMHWTAEAYRAVLYLHAEAGAVANTWTVDAWFMARR